MSSDSGFHSIDLDRLQNRLSLLGEVGRIEKAGVCRLALTDADRAGRDLVMRWMHQLGLTVKIDQIGNVWGIRSGAEDGPPVMIGSHIDTVATGGRYDGNLGVLAGLEIVEYLNDKNIQTRKPIAVAFFTNEEGARFTPDMMGSAVHQGSLKLEVALAEKDSSGATVGDELRRIGYDGHHPVSTCPVDSFLELHIEQGPVLEREGVQIGAVTSVQGISWHEWTIYGASNHAGTTPMSMRRDAGYVANLMAVEARSITRDFGGDQVATVGFVQLEPNLVNVIARKATITVDLRNTDWAVLQAAERRMTEFAHSVATAEGCEVESREMARFEPVQFDATMINAVERHAQALNLSVKRMPSGAGHDAQMFAPNCPAGMIFVQSRDGLSHNVLEYTAPEHLEAGANVLLLMVLERAEIVAV